MLVLVSRFGMGRGPFSSGFRWNLYCAISEVHFHINVGHFLALWAFSYMCRHLRTISI